MIAQEVVPGAFRIHSENVVNWYLVVDDGRVAAVDAGVPPDWDRLAGALDQVGRSLDQLEAVLLTHAHIDHTGFAERARKEAGATVHVHEAERELVDHQLRAAKSERNPALYAVRYGATRSLMLKMTKARAFQSRPIREYVTFTDGAEEAARLAREAGSA